MYKIGWFSSGRGSGSRELLKTMHHNIESGNVKARIEFVFCNREPGQFEETDIFLDQVRSYGIPLVCFSSLKFRDTLDNERLANWRIEYDREVMKRLADFEVELSVLAGYMLVVGPEMCRQYTMINLHPAEPGGPKGTWREVIWELIESRAEHTGVMMHLATPELDEGPPVSYCRFSIRGEPFDEHWDKLNNQSLESVKVQEGEEIELFRLIRQHGLKREFPLIVSTVKAFSEGRVKVESGKIIDSSGNPITGYDLSEEIDQIVN
ncbi:MAG: phosphoglycerate transporter [Chloroflexi bacterium]|nr:phosphoglycerate transporter [Chloroflexota bacterium]